jgi:hypothetical protein
MIQRVLLFFCELNLHGISQAKILHLSPKQRGKEKRKCEWQFLFRLAPARCAEQGGGGFGFGLLRLTFLCIRSR